MSAVSSRDEAIVALSSHPLWETYKAALLRLAEAREQFKAVPDRDTALREEVARHFRAALRDCDAVEGQIAGRAEKD